MNGSLREEIQQGRPFESLEVELFLNVVRTEDLLSWTVRRFLKNYGLSQPQYNVLRILRGAGSDGLACSHIADRMVARVPDITRLLDRLEAAGHVTRKRSTTDGRKVIAVATEKSLQLLAELDAPLREVHRDQLGHLDDNDLRTLIGLLEKCRQGQVRPTATEEGTTCPQGGTPEKDSANEQAAEA